MGITLDFPDEVVTKAPVRIFDLPNNAGKFALITLDNGIDHTRPTTLGPQGLANLDSALAHCRALGDADEIVAAGVTGKPYFFCAGADLKMTQAGTQRAEALSIAQYGHHVLRQLGDLGIPTFAFVNGLALGGGLEVALHCTYRTVSSNASALGLPECFLGILPGWGGATLVPKLVGVQTAVKVIIDNPMRQNTLLSPSDALELGLVHAMFDGADFLAQSLWWASSVIRGELMVAPAPVDTNAATWDAVITDTRARLDAKLQGAAPAPYRVLDLIAAARTADLTTAFAAEDEALTDLLLSPQFANSLYAFDLVNKRAKKPAGVPQVPALPITSVGVVGAGLMASQLALLFVRRLKIPVTLTDLDQTRVDNGVSWIHEHLDALVRTGKSTPEKAKQLKRLVTGSVDRSVFADVDVVIEAVFEEMSVKKQVFAELEQVVRPDCLLLTNTSSLSVTEMAADLNHPERVVGFHFFNPVAVLPLVEVVRTPSTDDVSLATAFALGKALKKSCVLVKDAPAFVVNRVLLRLMGEVMACVDEGTDLCIADTALDELGLPMSPFVLLQLVGPAVAEHVAMSLHTAFPDRFGTSSTLRSIVEQRLPGVYTAESLDAVRASVPGAEPQISAEATAILEQSGDSPSTSEQVRERALRAIATECRLIADEQVVHDVADIDLCLIMGAGWPFHLGGITPYLKQHGYWDSLTPHQPDTTT